MHLLSPGSGPGPRSDESSPDIGGGSPPAGPRSAEVAQRSSFVKGPDGVVAGPRQEGAGQVWPVVILTTDDPGHRGVEREGPGEGPNVPGASGEEGEGAMAKSLSAKFVVLFIKLQEETRKLY